MVLLIAALISGPSQCPIYQCKHLPCPNCYMPMGKCACPLEDNTTQPHIGNWRACRGSDCCDMKGYTGCYVTTSGSAELNATMLSFDSTKQQSDPQGYIFEVYTVTRVTPLGTGFVFKLALGKNGDGSFSGGFVVQRSADPMDIWRENVTVTPLPEAHS